jgi:RNA polymerase sigma-70 factor, ECF subfamily
MSARRSNVSLSLVVESSRGASTDAELAQGLAEGGFWAIEETWHRFAPMVLMMAERALGSRSEAEDVAQEVFYRVCRKAKTLREPAKLRSFIYSFAVRTVKAALRRRRVHAWLSFHPPEHLVEPSFATSDVESRDLLRRFYVLLDRLAPRDRLAFSLKYLESMTIEEIASTMELSNSTVKRSLSRASTRLSGWLRADPAFSHLFDQDGWQT